MADTDKIVEQLSGLTVLEIAGLVKQLEEKWGVSAAAPVAMAAAPAAGGGGAAAPAAEEKTTFEVILKEMGTNKIGVIKEVRSAVPGLGLAEAKALVEGAPKTIKEGVTKAEADEMKKKIEAAGAKVEILECRECWRRLYAAGRSTVNGGFPDTRGSGCRSNADATPSTARRGRGYSSSVACCRRMALRRLRRA